MKLLIERAKANPVPNCQHASILISPGPGVDLSRTCLHCGEEKALELPAPPPVPTEWYYDECVNFTREDWERIKDKLPKWP